MGLSIVVGWLCGWSGGLGRPWVWLVARPGLMQMLLAAVKQGLVRRGLVVEPLEGPRADSGSLVHRVRVSWLWGYYPPIGRWSQGLGFSTGLLAGRADSWSLAAGPGLSGAISDGWWEVGVGSWHSWVWSLGPWSLYGPARGQGQGPASPWVGCDLQLAGLVPRLLLLSAH